MTIGIPGQLQGAGVENSLIVIVLCAFLYLVLSNVIAALERKELLHEHVLCLVVGVSIVVGSVLSLRPCWLLVLDRSWGLLVEGLRQLLIERSLRLELILSVLLCCNG